MKLGISSYTFGWAVGVRGYPPPCPLEEQGLLDRASRLGVRLVQFGDNLPLHSLPPGRLESLAERAARDQVSLEVGARGLRLEHLATYITLARRLEARLIRFVIDDGPYQPPPHIVCDILRQALPLLGNLTLGLENHDRFPAATLRSILEEVGSPQIGICLDTANSLGAGEGLETVLHCLAPHTVNLHIKDYAIRRLPHLMGFTVEGTPAGAGALPLARLLEQLRLHGRCHTAVLELWPPPEQTLEQTMAKEANWATQSMEFLRPYFD